MRARKPGLLGIEELLQEEDAFSPLSGSRRTWSTPGSVGLRLGPSGKASSKSASAATKPKKKALILVGNGHDSIKKGVRFTSDKYFNEAATTSFAQYTQGHDVVLKHVHSAAAMKKALASGKWDTVVYFGHGVTTQMGLAPDEKGARLGFEDLSKALMAAGPKKVYLFGCMAGATGLARALSAKLTGTHVYGTFGSLDVEWRQSKQPGEKMKNNFNFLEPLKEYTNGYHTKNGAKMPSRPVEQGDDPMASDDPLGETIAQ